MTHLKEITADLILIIPFAPETALNGFDQYFNAISLNICFAAGYSESSLIRAVEIGTENIQRIFADMKYNIELLRTGYQQAMPAASDFLRMGNMGMDCKDC
jgi:hypothetical protein